MDDEEQLMGGGISNHRISWFLRDTGIGEPQKGIGKHLARQFKGDGVLAQVLCGFLAVPLEGIAAASIADGGHARSMKQCTYSVNTLLLCLVPAEIDDETLANTPM